MGGCSWVLAVATVSIMVTSSPCEANGSGYAGYGVESEKKGESGKGGYAYGDSTGYDAGGNPGGHGTATASVAAALSGAKTRAEQSPVARLNSVTAERITKEREKGIKEAQAKKQAQERGTKEKSARQAVEQAKRNTKAKKERERKDDAPGKTLKEKDSKAKVVSAAKRQRQKFVPWAKITGGWPAFQQSCGTPLPSQPCAIDGKPTSPQLVWVGGTQYNFANMTNSKGCGWVCRCPKLDSDGNPACRLTDARGQTRRIAIHADFRGGMTCKVEPSSTVKWCGAKTKGGKWAHPECQASISGADSPCDRRVNIQGALTQLKNAYMQHYNKARSKHIQEFIDSQDKTPSNREGQRRLGDSQGANASGRRRRRRRRGFHVWGPRGSRGNPEGEKGTENCKCTVGCSMRHSSSGTCTKYRYSCDNEEKACKSGEKLVEAKVLKKRGSDTNYEKVSKDIQKQIEKHKSEAKEMNKKADSMKGTAQELNKKVKTAKATYEKESELSKKDEKKAEEQIREIQTGEEKARKKAEQAVTKGHQQFEAKLPPVEKAGSARLFRLLTSEQRAKFDTPKGHRFALGKATGCKVEKTQLKSAKLDREAKAPTATQLVRLGEGTGRAATCHYDQIRMARSDPRKGHTKGTTHCPCSCKCKGQLHNGRCSGPYWWCLDSERDCKHSYVSIKRLGVSKSQKEGAEKAMEAKRTAEQLKRKEADKMKKATEAQKELEEKVKQLKITIAKKKLGAQEAKKEAEKRSQLAQQYASGLGNLTISLRESSKKWYARHNTMECGLSCKGGGRACCLDWQEEPIFKKLKNDINQMAVDYMGCFYNPGKSGVSWKLSQVSDLVRGASKNETLAKCGLNVEHQPPLDCRYEAAPAVTESLVHQEKRPGCKLPVDRNKFIQLCDNLAQQYASGLRNLTINCTKCKARQDEVCSFQHRLQKHTQDLQNAKKRAKEATNKNLLCRPSGSSDKTTGAAAVVDLFFGTAAGSCKEPSKHSSRWSDFWKKSKGSKPEGCVFTVALTLTQKSDKSIQTPLVQSYAAVANAESYEQRKCRLDDKRHCANKPGSDKGCGKFLWMADMIARDALTSTRFALAEQLLT